MRRLLAGLIVVVLLLGGWWMLREPPRTVDVAATGRTDRSLAADATTHTRLDDPARTQRLRDGAAAREVKRKQILAAMAARAATTTQHRVGATADAPPTTRPRRPVPPLDEATAEPAPMLLDRTGNHAYLSRVLSQDLMPLVDECGAQGAFCRGA